MDKQSTREENIKRLNLLQKKNVVDHAMAEELNKKLNLTNDIKINKALFAETQLTSSIIKIYNFFTFSIWNKKPSFIENPEDFSIDDYMDWSHEKNLLVITNNLEKILSTEGKAFLGFSINKNNDSELDNKFNKVFPYTAKIIMIETETIQNTILNLEIQINSFQLKTQKYIKIETFKRVKGGYETKTDIRTDKNKATEIPDSLQKHISKPRIIPVIPGEVFLNNAQSNNDIWLIIELAKAKGRTIFELFDNIEVSSPKVINKTTISGKEDDTVEQEFRDKKVINISSRAGQFQSPFVIFAPPMQTDNIIKGIDKAENLIAERANIKKESAVAKKAQQNDKEIIKQESAAVIYLGFKKEMRERNMTLWFKKIFKILNIKYESKFRFLIELSEPEQDKNPEPLDPPEPENKGEDE